MVYNLALHYVQNIEDAEEITQDVFLAVHQSLPQFNAGSEISTWIYRITINKSLDLIKSRNRKKRFARLTSIFRNDGVSGAIDIPDFNHPGVGLEQKEEITLIFSLINRLPDNQRTALILTKIEHKSQRETALIMNLSEKAVESLVQRAKKNLQLFLLQSEG